MSRDDIARRLYREGRPRSSRGGQNAGKYLSCLGGNLIGPDYNPTLRWKQFPSGSDFPLIPRIGKTDISSRCHVSIGVFMRWKSLPPPNSWYHIRVSARDHSVSAMVYIGFPARGYVGLRERLPTSDLIRVSARGYLRLREVFFARKPPFSCLHKELYFCPRKGLFVSPREALWQMMQLVLRAKEQACRAMISPVGSTGKVALCLREGPRCEEHLMGFSEDYVSDR